MNNFWVHWNYQQNSYKCYANIQYISHSLYDWLTVSNSMFVSIQKLSHCLLCSMCAFIFPRRLRRWITIWTVRLMAQRRTRMIKRKPQSARWAGWPQSKTGQGSWSQHRPLPAEFWWDGYTHTPTATSPDAHKCMWSSYIHFY